MTEIAQLINLLDSAEGKFDCFHTLIECIKEKIDCL